MVFLGKKLYRYFGKYSQAYGISRANYSEYLGESFDFFINANSNSRRYWANKNTYCDFQASTVLVCKTLGNLKLAVMRGIKCLVKI